MDIEGTFATFNGGAGNTRLRIVIVDRDRRFIASLARFLETQASVAVVGWGDSGETGMSAVAAGTPDIVLIGIAPATPGVLPILRLMRKATGLPRVIGLVDGDEDLYGRAADPESLDAVIDRLDLPVRLIPAIERLFDASPAEKAE